MSKDVIIKGWIEYSEKTHYQTPYLLSDSTYLLLQTDRIPAPENFGLLGAKVLSREEYLAHSEHNRKLDKKLD